MEHGPFRRQTRFETSRNDPGFDPRTWIYAYGPGDVRLMVEDSGGERRWTFRDPQDRVMREVLERDGAWTHERDFLYTPNGLFATRHHNGTVRYFHADHLGTPRLLLRCSTKGEICSRINGRDHAYVGSKMNRSHRRHDGLEKSEVFADSHQIQVG